VVEAEKFLRRSAGNDAAALQQHDAGSEEQSFTQIMRNKNDCFAQTVREGAEFALELGAGDGIECAEGLVHEENRRVGGEGAGDADALPLATREFAGAAAGEFARIEADKLEHFVNAGGDAGGVPFFQCGNEGDVFRNREMREKARLLNNVSDAAAKADGVPFHGGAVMHKD
jgi:hypothetical protein